MSESTPRLIVAVIGGSKATEEQAAAAESVGRTLAQAGAALICGGRGGVMAAACRGAKSAGGLTIGIMPGTDAHNANPYVDLPIVTGIGEARNTIIIRTAHAAIAIGGSYGTLSEIAFCLSFGLPVVGLGTWHMEREGHPAVPVHRAVSAEEAVERALELAQRRY